MAGAIVIRELLTKLGVSADNEAVSLFAKAIRGVKAEMQGAAGVAKGALSTALGTMASGVIARVTDAVRRMAVGIVSSNAEYEKLHAQLVTVTGSAEQAESEMKRIADLAVKTPFEVANLTDALVRLSVRGFDGSNASMLAFGDAAAAFSKDITEMVTVAAQLASGETEAFKSIGGAAKNSGDQITLSWMGVTRTMKRNAQNVGAFIREVSEANFAGAMERQAATIGGAFSNVKDALFQFSVQMGKAGLNDALRETAKLISGSVSEGASFAEILGKTLAFAVRRVNDVLRFFKNNMETIGRVMGVVAWAAGVIAASKLIGWLMATSRLFGVLARAMAPATLKFLAIAAALTIVALAIEDLIGFAQGKDSVIGRMLGEDSDEAKQLRADLQQLGATVKAAWDRINKALEGVNLSPMKVLAFIIQAIVVGLAYFIEGLVVIGHILGTVAAAIYLLFTDFDSYMREFGNRAEAFWNGIVDAVVGAIVRAWNATLDFLIYILTEIGGAFVALWRFVVGLVDAAVGFIEEILEAIVGFVDEWIVQPIKDLFSSMAAFIDEHFVQPVKKWLEWVIEKMEWVVDKAEDVGDVIGSPFDAAGAGLASAFGDESLAAAAARGLGNASNDLATGAARSVSNSSAVNVGRVEVRIDGSTNMGADELAGAVARGVEDGTETARAAMRALGGG